MKRNDSLGRRRQLLENLHGGWKDIRPQMSHTVDVNAMANVLEAYAVSTVSTAPKKRSYGIRIGIFATIAGVLLVTFAIPQIRSVFTSPLTATTREYSTTSGQRAKITLASGAQVTLAPSSKISVTDNKVTLDGQAVFTVLHSNHAVFTVHTGEAVIRVLGTTFSVRAYRSDNSTRVVVAEGKVAANHSVLSVSDAIDISRTGSAVRHGTDIAPDFSWTEGHLVFNDTPLSEVARQLERWYNVKIDISGTGLRDRPVTTSFTQQTLTAAELDLFAESVGLRYQRAGSHITFSKR